MGNESFHLVCALCWEMGLGDGEGILSVQLDARIGDVNYYRFQPAFSM